MPALTPRLPAVLACLASVSMTLAAVPAQGQTPERVLQRELFARQDRQVVVIERDQRAEDVRGQLRELMRRFPPALGDVLRLDPTLLTNESYLAPYPELAAFIKQHPEIPRSPEFYFSYAGPGRQQEQTVDPNTWLQQEMVRTWRDALTFLGILSVVGTIAWALLWLVRYFVSHRRWLRVTRLQSEVHGKLLERLTSNQELLAYMESPAGRQFLSATASPVSEPAAAPTSAPLSRILVSVQIGVVLVAAGAGMLYVKRLVPELLSVPLVIGVMGVAVGAGFIVAALASYVLSHRLGLLETRPARSESGLS